MQTLPVMLVYSIIPVELLVDRWLFSVRVNTLLIVVHIRYHY